MWDTIVTVSEFSRSEILGIFPEVSERVHIVHNFAVDKFFNRTPKESTRSGILHVSKLDPRKNHVTLLRAHDILRRRLGPEFSLTFAGGTGFRKYSRDIIRTFEAHPGVTYRGTIPDDALLASLYRSAKVFVFPSFHEGFGIPVVEAMACGTPVVASGVTALPEICRDAAIYVNPYNENEIAEAVLAIVSDPLLEKQLQEAGRRRARAFSKANSQRELDGVLAKALSASN